MISGGLISGGDNAPAAAPPAPNGSVVTETGVKLNMNLDGNNAQIQSMLAEYLKDARLAPLYGMLTGVANNFIGGFFNWAIASNQFATQEKIVGIAKNMKENDNETSVKLAGIFAKMNKDTTEDNNRTTVDVERIHGARAVEIAQIHDKGETERANLPKVDDVYNGRPGYPSGWPVIR